MLKRLRQRFRDMATIKELCERAERIANENGEEAPGAEHLLLSALELPDGTAKRALERLSVNPDALPQAIHQQYADALQGIGMDPDSAAVIETPEPITPRTILFDAKGSTDSLMKTMYKVHDKSMPLLSLHVLEAAATAQQGVIARAFQVMGIDAERLRLVVKEELREYQT